MVVLEQELGSFIGGHGNPRRNASRFMRRGFVGTPINFGDFGRGQNFQITCRGYGLPSRRKHVKLNNCHEQGHWTREWPFPSRKIQISEGSYYANLNQNGENNYCANIVKEQ